MLNEDVFLNSDNAVRIVVLDKSTNKAINFVSNGVTRMELYINGLTVSSDTSRLNYFDKGVVELSLGDLVGIEDKKSYPLSLKVFDVYHPNGQVMIHPSIRPSSVTVRVLNDKV